MGTYTAIQAAGAAGTCAQDLYAHFEKDVTQELPGFGDVDFKVYTKGAALQELYGSSHSGYLQELRGLTHEGNLQELRGLTHEGNLMNLNFMDDLKKVASNKDVDNLAMD